MLPSESAGVQPHQFRMHRHLRSITLLARKPAIDVLQPARWAGCDVDPGPHGLVTGAAGSACSLKDQSVDVMPICAGLSPASAGSIRWHFRAVFRQAMALEFLATLEMDSLCGRFLDHAGADDERGDRQYDVSSMLGHATFSKCFARSMPMREATGRSIATKPVVEIFQLRPLARCAVDPAFEFPACVACHMEAGHGG